MSDRVHIRPSILSADFGRVAEEARAIAAAGADGIHLDVMDGHFVPNLTFGPRFCRAVVDAVDIPCDAHLMVTNPEPYIDRYADAGVDVITVHFEPLLDPEPALSAIRRCGLKAGISINPDTLWDDVEPLMEYFDWLLIMTVFPGFSGQSFVPEVVPKIAEAKTAIDRTGADIVIQVDGGIDDRTAPQVVAAGARELVAGSYVFGAQDYREPIARLHAAGAGSSG